MVGCELRKIFDTVAEKIADWKTLARELLNRDEIAINRIDQEYNNIKERAYQTLLIWERKSISVPSWKTLKDALEKLRERQLIREIEGKSLMLLNYS